ncbi:hypothetical protein CBM2633_B90334 [Cupriavidus taiwanensis]|nr:hypothetical protein CBM2633_B90334 [Cupriavidus taiwanensis]
MTVTGAVPRLGSSAMHVAPRPHLEETL